MVIRARARANSVRPLFDWEKFSECDYKVDYEVEKRLTDLFHEIDTHQDGFITREELGDYIRKRGDFFDEQTLQAIIERGDIKLDGKLDYQEFMLYMLEHEQNLWNSFKKLDRDGNGQIGFADLQEYAKEKGLEIPEGRVRELIARLDTDNNLQIDWEEFREFNQFRPSYSIANFLTNSYYGNSYTDSVIIPPINTNKGSMSWHKSLICGGLAGVASRSITAPLDRLKVLLQVQGTQKVLGAQTEMGAGAILRSMYKEGVITMWKGNGMNCLKIFPESALRLLLFEYLLRHVDTESATWKKFMCGSVTGMGIQGLMYPCEILKTRLMVAEKGESLQAIARQLGFRGLFRGLSPALCGVVPFAGLELGLSRTMTDVYKSRYSTHQVGWWPLMGIGASSTFVAMAFTYPVRLITCQIQAYKGPKEQRPTFHSIASQLYRNNWGWKLWRLCYRGFIANCSKTLPASSIAWSAYNQLTSSYYDPTYERFSKWQKLRGT